MTGLALQAYLGVMDYAHGPRLSTELMRRCITQDTSVFDETDLDLISDQHLEVVSELIRSDVTRLTDIEQHDEMRRARMFFRDKIDQIRRELEPRASEARSIANAENGRLILNTLDRDIYLNFNSGNEPLDDDRPDFKGRSLTTEAIATDFARSVGTFTLTCSSGTCTITDYFDFEVDGETESYELLASAYRSFRGKQFDMAARDIGQMFCQEGENEKPTETSIPIRIEFEF
ncbi:hypothetical protein [Ruegeria profundi]|uniref:Uncharacterized protein n=1 Tax=Ruegeria profundi TaxID=1685378 RepID=A0A0X3TQC9_9RHOB|nr:hypothetical protein [Ruegeria profundi]KUJ77241.1 hypothetical protein AVO44_17810 [Ruegeria profundi]